MQLCKREIQIKYYLFSAKRITNLCKSKTTNKMKQQQ